MSKKLNINLFRDILNSDFFIITNGKQKVSIHPLVLLKNIKQFIRILKFSRMFKKTKFLLNIKNFSNFLLIKRCLKDLDSKYEFCNFNNKSIGNPINRNQLTLLLNFVSIKKNVLNLLMQYSSYIFIFFDMLKNNSLYIVPNKINNLKKIIFLFCLIQKVLK